MKRLLAFLSAASFAATLLAAQNTQPGPQGTTNNTNGPQMQMNPPQTSSAPAGDTTAPVAPKATAPADTTTTVPAAKSATNSDNNDTTSTDSATTNSTDATKPEDSKPAPATKSPHTEMFGTPSNGPQSADPLLQPTPLPPNKSTLVGGLVRKVDGIRNRVVIQPFGGKPTMTVFFDERSHIYRDGRETTVLGIKKGDRVYVDTMLVSHQVFARSLRVRTTSGPAEAVGQVVGVDPRTHSVRMIERLTGATVAFTVTPATTLTGKTASATESDLRPGSLVSVIFAPGHKGGEAREVSILAVPGSNYLFVGKVTNLDLHNGIIDVDNQSDGKNYEVRFDPATVENRETLAIGSQVAANASFDGRSYKAQTLTIMPSASEDAQQ